jgi:2-isopropylmalate synthase
LWQDRCCASRANSSLSLFQFYSSRICFWILCHSSSILSQTEKTLKDHLIIFDTTLRDGEQSPGASMTKEEKMRIARQLERMRVDVIEAGFPAASNGDFEAVKAVADAIRESTVCGLARAIEADIRRAGEALHGASLPRIHTFIATSPIHMEKSCACRPGR